jgi:uncharacterized membrane protein YfcA
VSLNQILFASLLIVVLAGLAVYYAWRQVKTLLELRHDENLPPEDRRYLRNQAWRRLACSGLMLAFAGLLVGSFFIEFPAQDLVNLGEAAHARNERPDLDPEQQRFFNFYTLYWVTALLVLLGMMATALYDLLAIRRFGQRHFRKLQADRRAMIERQAARLRQDRYDRN